MNVTNLEILAYEETPLGPLCLRRRELLSQPGKVVTEVTLNHEFLMSSLHTDSEQALSRIAIEMHSGNPQHCLIGGLGLGYTAHEALIADENLHVEVVELLPQVADWLASGLVPLSSELQSEPRLSVTLANIYQRLSEPPGKLFDLILIDVDHSPDDRLANESVSFYSTVGLQNAKKHLAEDGILGVWSYAESSPFAEALQLVFSEVRVEPVTHENQLINEQHTDWLFFSRG